MSTSRLVLAHLAQRQLLVKPPSAILASQSRVVGALVASQLRSFATQVEEEDLEELPGDPPEETYDGHRMRPLLQYLDDMLERTEILEHNLEELKKLHDAVRTTLKVSPVGVNWMTNAEIDALFDKSHRNKETLQQYVRELRKLYATKKKSILYAVDAPDGLPVDAFVREEMEEIGHWIADAAVLEDAKDVDYEHKAQDAFRKDRVNDPEAWL